MNGAVLRAEELAVPGSGRDRALKGHDRVRARLARDAQDRVQYLRLAAPVSGQNWTPHHPQTTTVPLRLWPLRVRAVARMA